uniref:Chromosome 1 open reading frame 158 n=1 Tax=Dromaius novaehollandiae TaxID=8790 RepID=A0A8C4KRY4_DRONO
WRRRASGGAERHLQPGCWTTELSFTSRSGRTVIILTGRVLLVRQRSMTASQIDGQDWWKIEPKYSTKVLIGNWLEERKRVRSGKKDENRNRVVFINCCGITDDKQHGFIYISFQGLPKQHFFTHHEEPSSRNLVSEYDDNYNRHGHNTLLPALRRWNGRKLAWIPEKSDFPILEPPTNYGLLEQLKKKWHKKEAGVMNSIYTVSYENPPISAFATCRLRQPAITHDFSSSQGHPPHNVSTTLDYEGAQKYLQGLVVTCDWKARAH